MAPPELDPVIHQASRLRILTALFKNRQLAVVTLRDQLGFTDGNLASHLSRLEEARYVKTGRILSGLSFEVHAKITADGSAAFRAYLALLRRMLEDVDASVEPSVPEAPRPSVLDLRGQDIS